MTCCVACDWLNYPDNPPSEMPTSMKLCYPSQNTIATSVDVLLGLCGVVVG